jgi:hypothetical protein
MDTMRAGRIVTACAALCAAASLAAALVSSAAGAQLQRVTVFGDSQIAGVAQTPEARAMLAKGIDLDLRAAVCRRLVQESCPFQGVRPSTVLDEIRQEQPPVGSSVVVLVGYNDFEAEWARDIAAVMRALVARDVTRVLWLTLTERRPDWVRMNADLRTIAKSWPQLEVLDWKDAADPSWFRGDDIHLTHEGAVGLASYVHVVLFARGIAAPSVPTAPAAPKVTLRVTIRGTGAVTVGGVRCRTSCSRLLPAGSVARLAARAPAGSVFDRWGGACAGSRPSCSVKVSRNATVVARFRARPR